MLAALIPAVTELASGYLSNRKEKAVAKQKLAATKIEAQVTKVQSDASWEERAIDSSATPHGVLQDISASGASCSYPP